MNEGATAVATDRVATLQRLEGEMLVLVRRVKRAVAERAEQVHEGLPPSAYVVLARLVEMGPQRSSAVAEAFALDKGAVSRIAQHLVDVGLVERSPDPDDGRASILTATPEAARRLTSVSRQRLRRLDARLGQWSAEDLGSFVATLARYNATLEELGG